MEPCALGDKGKSADVESGRWNERDPCDGRGKGWGDGFEKHFGERRGELAGGGSYGLQRACNGCWRRKCIAQVLVVGEVVLVEPKLLVEAH